MNTNIAFKVALPMVLAGMFIVVIFIAFNPQQMDMMFYIFVFLVFIFIFFYGFATGQRVAFPVKRLLKRAIDLSRGDLKSRFYMETKDEFGELAQIFNKIADELEQSRATEQNSEQAMDIKIRAKTQDMAETISVLEQKVRNRTAEMGRVMEELERIKAETKVKDDELEALKKNGTGRVARKIIKQ